MYLIKTGGGGVTTDGRTVVVGGGDSSAASGAASGTAFGDISSSESDSDNNGMAGVGRLVCLGVGSLHSMQDAREVARGTKLTSDGILTGSFDINGRVSII